MRMWGKLMSNVGENLRYWRIFDSGTKRTVIVAMDHGLFMGPVKGLAKPLEIVRRVLRAGANALIAHQELQNVSWQSFKAKQDLFYVLMGLLQFTGLSLIASEE